MRGFTFCVLFHYLLLVVSAGPVYQHLSGNPNGDSLSGSQSSMSNTPLPIEVRVTDHDGYFSDHNRFYEETDDILKQARTIIAVIDENHTLKTWQGAVNFVTDYNKPAIGDNMLEFWQSFEDILYVYHKFRASCNALGHEKECNTEKVLPIGDSFYHFFFRGVSHGLCIMRTIELPAYGVQQQAIATEKKELENFKNTIVASISQNHFTPLMLMETSVDEIQREFQIDRTAIQVHEEAIKHFIEPHLNAIGSTKDELQDAFKANTALQEIMKRLDRFRGQFEHHTKAVITQTSDLRQKTLNMLEYSEICSGTFSLIMKDRVNLIELCQDAHALFSNKAATSKGVGFLTRISAGRFNPYITTDHQRFKQALFAILQNSVQYSHVNGDAIQFTFLMEGDLIRFICKDFGCGISEENIGKICDAFYSYDAMGNHQQSLGLGLFLSKRIIESMNGAIEITSDDGSSTTVEIRLPMSCITHHQMEIESVPKRPDSPGPIDPRKPSMVTYNALSEPEPFYTTVIISEDSPLPGKLLKKWVEKTGYLCELYPTGEAALNAFNEKPQKYFAALLDFFTPPSPMRGSEVATSMLTRNLQLTIIIISANEDAVVREAVNTAGVQFMHKPFQHHKDELLKALKDAFDVYHGS